MAELPQQPSVADLINEHWRQKRQGNNRPHLGGSQIGKDCARALWYGFRWCKKPDFEGRILRLFQRGHDEEKNFIRDLRFIGVDAIDVDPDTGRQFKIFDHGGHFGGSLDGIGVGIPEAPKTPHLLEFKTSSNKAFEYLKANGVEKAKPEHYVQMQIYMGYYGLTRALYMVVNKDNDELYTVRIKFNKNVYDTNVKKAKLIIDATQPPARMTDDPEFFKCRWCEFHDICHAQEAPQQEKCAQANCRTCVNSAPVDTGRADVEHGQWHCVKFDMRIDDDTQRAGGDCPQHLFIPDLVSFGTQVDVIKNDDNDVTGIVYEKKGSNGKEHFTNVIASDKGDGKYLSRELQHMNGASVGDVGLDALREHFDGEVADPNQSGFVKC